MVDAQLVITKKGCDTWYLPYKNFELQDTTAVKELLDEIYSIKEKVQLACSCNPLKTSMVLSKTKSGRFFVKSKPNTKIHHLKCEFALKKNNLIRSEDNQSIYCPELFLTDRGNYLLTGLDLSLNSPQLKRNNVALKLFNFGRELLVRAWNHLMDNYTKKKSQYYPDINSIRYSLSNLFVGKKDYHKGITITPPITNVKFEKNICLEDILYLGTHSTAAIHAINRRYGVYALVFTPLYNSEISEYDGDHYLLTLSINNHVNGSIRNVHCNFIIKKKLFKASLEKFSLEKSDNYYNKKLPFYLIGLAKTPSYVNHPELVEIALIPVNYNGVIVRNIEELRFTNLLCFRRRIFKKPISRTIHFKHLIPSFILFDSIKPTICEVIVDSSNSMEKIEIYNNQTDFLFYAWLAYKYTKITENIPDIYKR